jgi:hypothetical protein
MCSTNKGQSWKPGDPIPAKTFTLDDMGRAQGSEVRLITEGKVLVPDKGTFLVRNGKADAVAETDLVDCDADHWAYTVWIKREIEEDGDDDE